MNYVIKICKHVTKHTDREYGHYAHRQLYLVRLRSYHQNTEERYEPQDVQEHPAEIRIN